MTATWEIRQGNALDELREMPDGSVQCCVTSPPYFRLRDYGMFGQIGLEATADEYVAKLVAVFREVRRVLRDDGTLWLVVGDSYAGSWGAQSRGASDNGTSTILGAAKRKGSPLSGRQIEGAPKRGSRTGTIRAAGCKQKDLYGIPWMLAFALRADGWWLRSEIIWSKPNPMPESVTDRPTSAHEKVFLLAKQARYFYDADAIREGAVSDHRSGNGYARDERESYRNADGSARGQMSGWDDVGGSRNRRNVWEIATQPFSGSVPHFATFPPKLVEPCILAGSAEGALVLDPFAGSGTTGVVALRHGRSFVGIELSEPYCALARRRILDDAPLLNQPAECVA